MHSTETARRWDAWPARSQPVAAATVDRSWDPLLASVAAYILFAVGRAHELFRTIVASGRRGLVDPGGIR